jgi:cytochrome c-type biogenesis protein CcmH/NrfG
MQRFEGQEAREREDHLRKAVQAYPQYAAAWALLGQVLEAGNRIGEARSACSQASSVDSSCVPAYLCLADVAAQLNQWQQELELAERGSHTRSSAECVWKFLQRNGPFPSR